MVVRRAQAPGGRGELVTVTTENNAPPSQDSPAISTWATNTPSVSSSYMETSRAPRRLEQEPHHAQSHSRAVLRHSPERLRHSPEREPSRPDTSDPAIILVMGVTGSGKSSFIDLLSDTRVQVGHSLTSCTTDPESYVVNPPGSRRAYLIDTPGFDDTTRSDADILKGIAFWLNSVLQQGKRISALVYMHRITDVRMGGAAVRNLELFRRICGRDAYPHVALVSTMWEMMRSKDGQIMAKEREETLLQAPRFWKEVVGGGARVFRHEGTESSAREIFNKLPINSSGMLLNLQREMMNGISLEKTAAGLYLEEDLNKMKDKYESELRQLQKDLEEVRAEGDIQGEEIIRSEQATVVSRMDEVDKGREALNIDVEELNQEKVPQYRETLELQQRKDFERDPTLKKLFQRLDELEHEITDLKRREKQQAKEISRLHQSDRDRSRRDRDRDHHRDHVTGRRPSTSSSPSKRQRLLDLEARKLRSEAQIDDRLIKSNSPMGLLWRMVGASFDDSTWIKSSQRSNHSTRSSGGM